MCGIAGILDLRGTAPIDSGLLRRMNDLQVHRGPDGDGVYHQGRVGLAHRRLAIIDVAAGQQPLSDNAGAVTVVFNGEIYNFRELAKELEQLGHHFKTHSDTEVIVHGWKQWGVDCVKRFRGMFAFALWDKRTETLFLARDRFGIKPLFHAVTSCGQFVFASELKSVLAHPGVSRSLCPMAVEEYFTFSYVPDPRTIYAGVAKLEPGHTMLVTRNGPQPPQQYWDVPAQHIVQLSDRDAEEQLREQLTDAVGARLVSEVPLGAFLSGGVDSSAVVAIMAGLMNDAVDTCSISFDDKAYNESEFADMVAKRYHTRHYAETVQTDDYGLIDQLGGLYDEPYGDSSAIPTYRVCELARKKVTVALSGDGGDEVFGGYRRYRWFCFEQRFRNLLPDPVRRPLFRTLGDLYPKLDQAPRFLRAKSTLQAIGRDALEGYLSGVSIATPELRHQLFSQQMRSDLQGYSSVEVFRRHQAAAGERDALGLIQYLDMKTYLPGDILTKVDRASMAHSLEVRVPFLDHKLVEWAMGLELRHRLRGQEGKHVLKKAMEPHLPHDVLYRPKMGFAVPLERWFREGLRDRVKTQLLDGAACQHGWFDGQQISQMVDDHQSGRRNFTAPIWSMLMFDDFLRRNEQGVAGNSRADASPAIAAAQ